MRIGGNRFNLVLYNSVLVVSPMPVIQSSPFCGRTSSQFAEACHLPHASPRPGAHCSGTTAVVSLTRSSVPREVDDCSIQVASFFAALSLSSLDRLRASRLLLPRSGLERSDFVPWHLVLLRHKVRRLDAGAAQQGHRGRAMTRTAINRRRIVAIEFGTCRSGRRGGASGSMTAGKHRCREAPGGTRS